MIDANDLERMARERPDEKFLKGSGVLKLTGAIRDLERQLGMLRAERAWLYGWQPIATAPKDGTVIDVWHEEFGREAGVYWGLPHHCCGEWGNLCDSEWHDLAEGWVDAWNDPTSGESFTHWMPVPSGPVPVSEAGG